MSTFDLGPETHELSYVHITSNKQVISLRMDNFAINDLKVVAKKKSLTISGRHEMRWESGGYASRQYLKQFNLVEDADLNNIVSAIRGGYLIIGMGRTGDATDESQPTSVDVEIQSQRGTIIEAKPRRRRRAQAKPPGDGNIQDTDNTSAAKSTTGKSSDTLHDEPHSSVEANDSIKGDNATQHGDNPSSSASRDNPTPGTSDNIPTAEPKQQNKTPNTDATLDQSSAGKKFRHTDSRDNAYTASCDNSQAAKENRQDINRNANATPRGHQSSTNPTRFKRPTVNATGHSNNPAAAGVRFNPTSDARPRFNPTSNAGPRFNPTSNERPRFNPVLMAESRFTPNADDNNNPPAGTIPRFNNPTADGTPQYNYWSGDVPEWRWTYFGEPRYVPYEESINRILEECREIAFGGPTLSQELGLDNGYWDDLGMILERELLLASDFIPPQ